MTEIKNNGKLVVSTNYWQTPNAAAGQAYLSMNAGAFRLLVPGPLEADIADMKTGREAIVSFGVDGKSGKAAYEVMFDDGSESPYTLITSNFDRRLPERRRDKTELLVYTSSGLVMTVPARFRWVDTLPCLEPWDEQAN